MRPSLAGLPLLLLALPTLSFAQVAGIEIRPLDLKLGDEFGTTLDLLGPRLLVGSRLDTTFFGQEPGRVHMFDPTTGAEAWRVDGPQTGQSFGKSLALGSQYAFVGAPTTFLASSSGQRGRVYAYDLDSGALAFSIDPPVSAAVPMEFGASLTIAAGVLYVGAPGASTVFLHDELTGAQTGEIARPGATTENESFGWSLASIAGRLAVGEPNFIGQVSATNGTCYLFDTTGPPALIETLTGFSLNGYLGASCGVNATEFVGLAPGQFLTSSTLSNAGLRFAGPSFPPGGQPVQNLRFSRDFGRPQAVEMDATLVLVGGPSSDELARATVAQVTAFDPQTALKLYELRSPVAPLLPEDSAFGSALALDGALLAVGDPFQELAGAARAGTVYLFDPTPRLPLLTEVFPYAFPESTDPAPDIIELLLRGSAASPGELYFLLGSRSGSLPGLVLDGFVLPLNYDGVTAFTLKQPNSPSLQNTLGTFGALPLEEAAVVLPGLLPLGTEFSLAFLTVETSGSGLVSGVSEAVSVTVD